MNKKNGIIFLMLGIALIGLYFLYSYSKMFDSNISSNNSVDNKDVIVKTKPEDNFVKSHDFEQKTKISFYLQNNLIIDDYYSNDYYKYFQDNDQLSLAVGTFILQENQNEYISTSEVNYKNMYESNNMVISSKTIECDYLCRKTQIYNVDNSLYLSELKIYYFFSDDEVFELTYQQKNNDLSEEFINKIIKSIQVSHDATYTIGEIAGNKLSITFPLKNNKSLTIKVDSNTYEEIIKSTNSTRFTNLVNKNTFAELEVYIQFKKSNHSLLEELNTFFESKTKKEIVIGSFKGYETEINNAKKYAIIIDDEIALLINDITGTTDVNDFSDIVIKDI